MTPVPMRAITLHQPWASFIAEGHKWIETRSWATKYRGPIAIHAAARPIGNGALYVGDGKTGWTNVTGEPVAGDQQALSGGIDRLLICPLGAVVATALLVDCVPMRTYGDPAGSTGLIVDAPHEGELRHQQGGLWLIGVNGVTDGTPTYVEDQRPYGDFAPGRWAWLLSHIVRVDPPIRAKGAQGIWQWTPAAR